MRKKSALLVIRAAIVRGLLLCAILLPLLVLLKVAGIVGWSWWWVLTPLWIPFAIVLAILAGFAVMSAAIALAAICAELSEKY